MKKDRVLRGLIIAQAVCMIVLGAAVSIKVFVTPPAKSSPVKGIEGEHPGGNANQTDVNQMNPKHEDNPIAAKVGGETIPEQEFLQELRNQYGDTVLRTMMLRKAVRLEADADGLTVSEDEVTDELARMMKGYDDAESYYAEMKEQLGMDKAAIKADTEYRLLLEKIAIRDVTITDNQVKAYIQDHPDEFEPQTKLRLSWIVSKTKKESQGILEMAHKGEDFAALARTYSIDDFTADNGGDMGIITTDDPFVDPDIMKEAEVMKVGGIAGPFKTDSGWAVIQLVERDTTTEYDTRKRNDAVRLQLALAAASPLHNVEDELLDKYKATTYPPGK